MRPGRLTCCILWWEGKTLSVPTPVPITSRFAWAPRLLELTSGWRSHPGWVWCVERLVPLGSGGLAEPGWADGCLPRPKQPRRPLQPRSACACDTCMITWSVPSPWSSAGEHLFVCTEVWAPNPHSPKLVVLLRTVLDEV